MSRLTLNKLLILTSLLLHLYPTELLTKSHKSILDHQPPTLTRYHEFSDNEFLDEQEKEFSDVPVRPKRVRSSRMRHAVRAGAKIGAIIGAVLATIGVIARIIPFLTMPVMPIQIPLFILSAALVIGISSAIHAAQGAVLGAIIMKATDKEIEKEKRLLQLND